MKKTFSVNLGNRVYNIDEDAYQQLKTYLGHIESHFADLQERQDVMNDIELRISELFTEKLGVQKQVITIADVQEVISTMGDPNEIGGSSESPHKEQDVNYHTSRRIYRDPDNRMLGGVCSGLASYVNIDPTIMRLIFVALFLTFGVGFLAYIILWIVVPEAHTTAQKLEMRGEPVNASNIGNFFREEFENVRKSFRRKK
jgi:phage shock protein PspC (stress-responsive transcriptional regulator)